MKHRLPNLLKVTSALLLVAVVALLVVGRPRGMYVTLRESPASVVVAGVEGYGFFLLKIAAPGPGWRDAVPRVLYDWTAEFAGFKVGPELPPAHWPGTPRFVVVPAWFLALVFGTCAVLCGARDRRGEPAVTGRRRALAGWLSRSRLYVPMLLLVGAGWTGAYWFDGRTYAVNGSRAGLVAVADSGSLIVGVRRGWPSRDWIEREHLRAVGGLWGDGLSSRYTLFGIGVLAGECFWNGHEERAVWHRAVVLPWWYLVLLFAAAPLEQLGRWVWSNRRSERRRRSGACLDCGYDLTGNVSGVCPECGSKVARA
jgi:hypothetical protein